MSRLKNSVYNTIWALVGNLSIALFGIVSRSIFVNTLGDELMGVNSLFADVLTLFSFVDMGFGTAITFALYKPIAKNNVVEIKAVLRFLQRIFNIMAIAIVLIGICFFPYLGSLKTEIPLKDLRVYYIIFMFNNVIGYLWTYRLTYVTAKQEARRITAFDVAFSLGTTMLQIAVVILVESFLLYLLMNSLLLVIKKVAINVYIAKRYPESNLHDAVQLGREDRGRIWTKAKSLAVHKIANLSISQTDSLIVSYMISVKEWGLVSNYLMLKNTISGIASQVYSAILPSMGDLVARESKDKQLSTFYVYDFLNFWVYAFCFVALATLSSPFVSMVFGASRVIDHFTVFVFFLSFFIAGLRDPVSILREANGAYETDQIYTVISAVVNLVASVIFVKTIGLPGVFLGTLCSTAVVLIARPIILFNQCYHISSKQYFKTMAVYILAAVAGYIMTEVCIALIAHACGITILSFLLMMLTVALLPNIFWIAVFYRNRNFKELLHIMVNFVRVKKGKNEI